jgi:uncharacterized lipoprotein YbaY
MLTISGKQKVFCSLVFGTLGLLLASGRINAQVPDQMGVGWQDWSNWNSGMSTPPDSQGSLGVRQSSSAWVFGARGVATRTGVMLREVVSGSPASRAGLASGDTVVSVGGAQVGLVGNRLFDLEEEVNRRADRNGAITLVIYSRASSRLENIDVQLVPSLSEVKGMIVGLDPLRMPSDSVITVQIVNVTRPHIGVRNGSVTLRPTSNSAGIPFAIAYDPAYIYSEDEYAVRAQVSSAGNLIFQSDRNVKVLTQGNSNNVQLRLVPATTNWPTSPGVSQLPGSTFTNSDAINRQIQAYYRRYLGRDPYYTEQAALTMDPRIDERLRSLPLDLMATQEFYDAVGNNEAAWISRVFVELAGRPPQPNELQNWQRRFAELRYSRAALLNQLNSQIPR